MKNFRLILSILLVIITITAKAQWTVQTVPDPKKTDGGYVSNPDKILSLDEVSNLNNLIRISEDSTKIQIAVVILKSIGTAVPKQFATELFNLWGVGNKETNSGILILFVKDQRRIEFETGYGIEAILTDAKCYEIQQNYMVPKFKVENYNQGMIDGVLKVIEVCGALLETNTSDVTTTSSDNYLNQNSYNSNTDSSYNYSYHSFLGYYIRFVLLALLVYIILFSITLFQHDFFVRYKTLRIFKLYIWFILFPIPFVALYYFTKNLMEKWRNAPRISAKTSKLMRKLSEEEDDKYLQSGQVTEEQIKSIDYDVWVSEDPDDILILGYKRWFTKYSGCPKCKFKTYYTEYNKVLVSPTYSSSGKGERKYYCANCHHSKIETYTIPRKTKSSSGGYSSSSRGSSSSFGGSRSWGGGSSGGGGAGSSW